MSVKDWTKPLETCEDPPRKVWQVLTTTRNSTAYPVVVEFEDGDIEIYTLDGYYHSNKSFSEENLRNVPEKKEPQEMWVNIYSNGRIAPFLSEEISKERAVGMKYKEIAVRFIRADD